FSAEKTQIMHFSRSRSAKPFLEMPGIPGLPNKAETVIKILGIHLDYRLTWANHIAYVRRLLAKAGAKMRRLSPISGSTWGPPLIQLRQLYITCIRPMLSYACAVWFVLTTADARCKWTLTAQLLKQLEIEDSKWLRQISGAFTRTSGDVLCKELFVEKISVYLAHR
ncbi:hypothetical protein LY76DRAFT_469421, partial [Colletotrichum caudatum]